MNHQSSHFNVMYDLQIIRWLLWNSVNGEYQKCFTERYCVSIKKPIRRKKTESQTVTVIS